AVDTYIDDKNRFRPDSDSDSESEGELLVDHPNGPINSTDSSYEYDVAENIQLDDYQFEHGVGVIANDLTDPNTKVTTKNNTQSYIAGRRRVKTMYLPAKKLSDIYGY
ncbi:unnamed protein product, partial [Adineta ricciae]